ncbi:MAG: site-specific integrase, partial [Oscillospiraceae bacterium]|nr:site-specific integrase [Oscillospiraceae bacterium]
MDVKMLSEIIGHTTVATTLDTYVHITDTMRQDAADNIDRGIGKHEPKKEPRNQPEPEPFVPGKGKRRKQG